MQGDAHGLFVRIVDAFELESPAGEDGWGTIGGVAVRVVSLSEETVFVRFRVRYGAVRPLTSRDTSSPSPMTRALRSAKLSTEWMGDSVGATFRNIDQALLDDAPEILRELAEGMKEAPATACTSCGTEDEVEVRPRGATELDVTCRVCEERRDRLHDEVELQPSAWLGAQGLAWLRDVALASAVWAALWVGAMVGLDVLGFREVPFAVVAIPGVFAGLYAGNRIGKSARRWRGVDSAMPWAVWSAVGAVLVGTVLTLLALRLWDGLGPMVGFSDVVAFVSYFYEDNVALLGVLSAAMVGGALTSARVVE